MEEKIIDRVFEYLTSKGFLALGLRKKSGYLTAIYPPNTKEMQI